MERIIVKTQAELDALPAKFATHTVIEIRGGVPGDRIIVRQARENSSVVARGNSSVAAYDSSRVEAWDSSSVVAWGSSSVVAWDSSSVVAWGSSSVVAYEFATLVVFSAAVVIAHLADHAVARLRGVKPKIERKDDSATVLEEPELLNIPFETWLERGYVVADGLRAKHISTKQVGNATVYTVRMSVLDKEDSYVVRVGDKFAHGRTIDQAVKDIRYKIADRDTTRFKSWKKDDERSLDELIEAYRAITGACEFGTRHFVESQGELPERLTVARAIELTRGQYNSKRFEEFFEA